MITVVGENGCGQCTQAKQALTQFGIEFQYVTLSASTREEQDKFLSIARAANHMSLPIILDESGAIIALEDIIRERG